MAIKFSQFNERTESTATMSLVGYDGEQNIRILADDLLANPYINGTENTLAMFGTGGTIVVDSIVSQDAGATLLTVAGQLNVDAAATFDTSITVTGDSTLNGNVILGDASADLITQTGTLYLNGPIKDTTDTLGATDQILVSDASGELTFTDLADISAGAAEVVEVPVKNLQGSPLTKGDPVFISGSVGTSGKLEVQLADASNAAKMPALGLLKQDLAINEEGFVVVTGKLRNLTTDPIDGATPSPNDVIYVKGGGTTGNALTLTKPTGADLIQNMGKVGRVSTANDGTFVVSSILRTNDVPNLTQGKIWVGSTGNTIESSSITFTEATGAVQLNEYGVGSITGTAAYNLSVDASGNIIETTAVPGNIVETLTAASGTYISLTDATSATGDVDLGTFDLSAIDGSSDTTTRFLSKDNTWDIPSYTTVTTTDGTYINLTPNSATSGAVTVTADLSAVDGVAAVGERYLTKNNTWAEVATIPGTYTFNVSDGTASTTINSGDTLGILGGTYITTSNTTGNVTINHDATSRTDTTSTSTPGYGGTFTVVDSISTNATGHLEAINVKTVTMPPADDTNTTYDLSGFGTTNGTAGVQLIGSDGSVDQVAVTGAGTTTVVHSGNTLTITSNDQYTGTVTSVSGGTYITDTGTATDPVLNHDATSRTDTTSTDSPGVSGSFTAVDSVTTNATGHVTAINVKTVTLPDDGVDGSGTLNYVAKWTPDGDTLGDSIIYDDGTNVGVGIASPSEKLEVSGKILATGGQVRAGSYLENFPSFSFANDTDTGMFSDTADQLEFSTAGSSRVTIDSTGNVGIGTTNPANILHVSSDAPVITGTSTNNSSGLRYNVTGTANTVHRFQYGGSTLMTIRNTGNVGIGTTSPSQKLEISDSSATTIRIDNTKNSSWTVGEELGKLEWYGNDASGEGAGVKGYIKLDSDNIYGAGFDMRFGTTDGTNGITERMVITKVGNVGIGTSSPDRSLVVNHATDSRVKLQVNGTDTAQIQALPNEARYHAIGSSTPLGFWVNGAERARIGTSGNVGIGKTNPSYPLDVSGNARLTGDLYVDGAQVLTNSVQSRVKYSVWNSTTYGIGMQSGYTYGHLNNEYAMTFQFSDTSDRGFWWGDTGHTNAQGAMSLTTAGEATIATSLSVGEGQSITSPSTKTLYVSGDAAITGNVGIGTTNPGSKLQIGDTATTSNVAVRAISEQAYQAGFEAYGSGQGTGYMYVGQSLTYGGGVAYNGDGSPAAFDSGHTGSDKITFFRRENSTDTAVMWYGYNSDDVNFRGNIKTSAYTIPNTAGTSGQVLKWPASGTTLEWGSASGSYTPSAISTNTNAVNNYLYILTANLTLTLPASPSAGDSIKIANFSGVTTCVIARNGNNIMASATDLTLDNDKANFELVYTDATRGWVIIGATGELN